MENVFHQFRHKFIEEAQSLLENLERALLQIEEASDKSGYIEEIFRIMHTLKGVSGMYGFAKISEFTHSLENIYDKIRAGKEQLSKKILNLTFSAIDHIGNLLNTEDSEQYDEIHRFLLSQINSNTEIAVQPTEETNLKTELHKHIVIQEDPKLKTYYIMFWLDEAFFKRAINLLGIFNDLTILGKYKVFKHNLPNLPLPEDTDPESVWGIFLTTEASVEEVKDVFVFVEDNYIMVKISNNDLFLQYFETDENDGEIEHELIKSSYEIISNENIDITEQPEIKVASQTVDTPKKASAEKPLPETKVCEQKNEHEAKLYTDENKNFDNPATNIVKHLTSRISVDAEKLDRLMYLVSELVTTNSQLFLANKHSNKNHLDNAVEKIEKLSKQFRDNALSLRLIPINDVVIRFQRLIRDLSQSLNKEVKFTSKGTETELDKSIIEALVEPIMHLIRNCLDHGIELPEVREQKGKTREGHISLNAFYSGTSVYIKIEDDGSGIDTEKIWKKAVEKNFVEADAKLSHQEILNLIFLPGFSTAENLTQVSGRGVGMDVVRKKISDVRGDITVDTVIGHSTSFTIKIQQTISIIDTLLVKAQQTYFLIPLNEIEICDRREHQELELTQNRQIEYQQSLVPYIHLRREFLLEGDIPKIEKVVFINRNGLRLAIITDSIIGEHQAVLKPLGKIFHKQEFLLGASVMGDGNMALMLDTVKLLENVYN